MGDDFAVIAQAAPGNHQTAEAGAAVAGGAVLAGDHNGLGRESQGDFPGAAAVARVGAAGNFWQRRLQTASLVRQGLQLGIQFFPVAVEFLPQDAGPCRPSGNLQLTHTMTHEQKKRGGNNGEKRICG